MEDGPIFRWQGWRVDYLAGNRCRPGAVPLTEAKHANP